MFHVDIEAKIPPHHRKLTIGIHIVHKFFTSDLVYNTKT